MTDPLSGQAVIPAAIGRRVAAYAIDLAIALVIPIVFGLIGGVILLTSGTSGSRGGLPIALLITYGASSVVSVAWLLVYTAMQGGRGSIGQRARGLMLADATTGGDIGFWRALLRNVVWALAAAIVVGYFTPLFDSSSRRQGWHDRAARTVVGDRKAAEAAASAVAPPLPAPAANPFLPPPAGATATASVVAPPAPVRTAGFAPPASAPAGAVASAPAIPVAEGLISQVPGVSAPPVPAVASDVAARAASPASDDVDATRAGRSSAPAVVAATWDDGTRFAVYGRTLFGRNPATEDGATAVAVRDETLSLSKTHFELDGDAGGAWVIDRHSTNGTALVRDGERLTVEPGERTTLRAGDRLEFGDRSLTIGGGA
ncbi:RDD family protein [Microbacterium rhizomatis]|uniref:FHA domain-containing protein n=1 Tax=Microbacterium rhizomatis TaxID=1631477 RepID=A0A5J5J1H0_9MICO|nr:RDD family protein [Microbacterium rhizomatis]KAA9106453.1 FHA domain-containing protein [Microbacterium rhizomatis]